MFLLCILSPTFFSCLLPSYISKKHCIQTGYSRHEATLPYDLFYCKTLPIYPRTFADKRKLNNVCSSLFHSSPSNPHYATTFPIRYLGSGSFHRNRLQQLGKSTSPLAGRIKKYLTFCRLRRIFLYLHEKIKDHLPCLAHEQPLPRLRRRGQKPVCELG